MPGSVNNILSPQRGKALEEFRLRDAETAERGGLRSGLMLESRASGSLQIEARFGKGDDALRSFQSLAERKSGGELPWLGEKVEGTGFDRNPTSWTARVGRFFHGIYRRWASGPPGFLLMGASFLLGDPAAFQNPNPLDLTHDLDYGWPSAKHPELEEITGPLSRVVGSSSEGVFLVLKDAQTQLWLLQDGEWQRRSIGDRMKLEPGAVFAVGERPRWANRSGYHPDKTRVYRFETDRDAGGRFQILELAHAEDQLQDFLVRQLHRRFSFVSPAVLLPAVRAMVREAEALGGEPQARVEFLKENVLESITAITLGAMRLNPLPLVDFLRQLFSEFKDEKPEPASVFYLTERLLLNFFLLLNPPQQTQKILDVVKNMRAQGYSAGELSRWIDNFDLVPMNFLENVEHIPTLVRKLRSWGLTADQAETTIFRILDGFEERDEVATPETAASVAKFVVESGWEPEAAVEVAFRTRRVLEEASDMAEGDADAPPRWDDKVYWSYVLNHAARFATYLKGFGVTPERSRQIVESLVGAYREDVVPTLIELMKPEFSAFFEHWQRTFSEFLEEMRRYFPPKKKN